ncbi:hypothetical protein ABZ354_28115 [Streptomyces sp. NPDC005925]|uniref:hypothetical protein n=1 Tax=Streptomyces sp. NPDC005925 TaxID=3157172 RepID=UPI003410583E
MTLTEADSQSLKAALAAVQAATWHVLTFPTPLDAVNFVNRPPAQGAGQVAFSYRPDGQVDLMFFL